MAHAPLNPHDEGYDVSRETYCINDWRDVAVDVDLLWRVSKFHVQFTREQHVLNSRVSRVDVTPSCVTQVE